MPDLMVIDNATQSKLLTTVVELINVRNHLMNISSSKLDKTTYKRVNDKIASLDKQILNLSLLIDPVFKVVP
jgi:hypothetical protein